MRRIVQYILALLLVGYLFAAYLFAQKKASTEVCNGIVVRVLDSDKRSFTSQANIERRLKREYDLKGGYLLSSIETEEIEQLVLKDRLIANASCYTTNNNYIYVDVRQRTPVLRVVDSKGGYYIDSQGEYMPTSPHYAIPLLVASGNITVEYAQQQLYPLALAIGNDRLWQAQIEQIAVLPNKDIVLVPRVGSHKIILGTADNYEAKLKKLKVLYEKVIAQKGWNTYTTINLKYKDQVVCTKR